MTKKIQGYIRDIPNGTALPNIPVTIKSDVDGSTIAVGGMWMGSANPVNTDPSTGLFTWTCELSPGPLRIDADLGGGAHKVRSGREVMQSAELYLSDLPTFYNVFTNGVVGILGSTLTTTSAGLNLTVQPGAAILKGMMWQTLTNRVVGVGANGTVAERWDLLVLEQHVGGTQIGRQNLALVPGVANQTDPTINTDPNIFQYPIYRVKIANGAGVVTLVDLRTYTYSLQGPNSVTNLMLTAGGQLSTAEIAKMLKAPTSGLTPTYDQLALGELANVAATAPTNGQLLQYNGSLWVPFTPAYAAAVHTHAAADIVSGTIATARLGGGAASASTYLRGDQNWSGIAGTHITTGLVDTARLGGGAASSATFLRGDQSWAAVSATHDHDFAACRFATSNNSFSSPVGPLGAGDTVVDSFTIPVSANQKYSILAHAVYEGYADAATSAIAQLGISVGGSGIVYGSGNSGENESGVVAATAADVDVTTGGTTITVTVYARRQSGTGNCYVRAGHAFAFAVPANSLAGAA
jgi:hypothetical protein